MGGLTDDVPLHQVEPVQMGHCLACVVCALIHLRSEESCRTTHQHRTSLALPHAPHPTYHIRRPLGLQPRIIPQSYLPYRTVLAKQVIHVFTGDGIIPAIRAGRESWLERGRGVGDVQVFHKEDALGVGICGLAVHCCESGPAWSFSTGGGDGGCLRRRGVYALLLSIQVSLIQDVCEEGTVLQRGFKVDRWTDLQ